MYLAICSVCIYILIQLQTLYWSVGVCVCVCVCTCVCDAGKSFVVQQVFVWLQHVYMYIS